MGIDVAELKERIAKVRSGVQGVRPRASGVQFSDHQPSQPVGGLAQRLYALPVVGYYIRILAAVYNFPRILANLQLHYSAHANDAARFYSVIDDLQLGLERAEAAAREANARADRLEKALKEVKEKVVAAAVTPAAPVAEAVAVAAIAPVAAAPVVEAPIPLLRKKPRSAAESAR